MICALNPDLSVATWWWPIAVPLKHIAINYCFKTTPTPKDIIVGFISQSATATKASAINCKSLIFANTSNFFGRECVQLAFPCSSIGRQETVGVSADVTCISTKLTPVKTTTPSVFNSSSTTTTTSAFFHYCLPTRTPNLPTSYSRPIKTLKNAQTSSFP